VTHADVRALIPQLDALIIALFDVAAENGYIAASYAADGVRRRKDDLLVRLQEGNLLPIATRLLDVVPNAKDLDAIGFDLRRYPAIADALLQIEVQAAKLADPYLDA